MRSPSVSQKWQHNHREIREIKRQHRDETKTSSHLNKILYPALMLHNEMCKKTHGKHCYTWAPFRLWEGTKMSSSEETCPLVRKRAPWEKHAAMLCRLQVKEAALEQNPPTVPSLGMFLLR